MAQNPDWPLIDEAISFQTGPNDPMPAPYWCSVIDKTEGSSTSERGRQYELDQVQAGVSALTLKNTDGAFDASNTASIFYPKVTSYRAHRRRAQYPATVNLLTADQATAFFASRGAFAGSVLPTWVTAWSSANVLIANSGTFNFFYVTYGAAPPIGHGVQFAGWSVTPGQTYSGQCQANGTAGGGLQMRLALAWFDATGAQIGAVNGTPVTITSTPVTASVSGTAPANAAGASLVYLNANSPAGATVGSCWNVQVEVAAAPTTWVQPSPWYDIVTDYVERWPQAWSDGGTYGTVTLECVDAFGYLSQRKLLSPAYMEVLALGPTFFYPMDEPSDATVMNDLAGNRQPATFVPTSYAPGKLVPGAQLEVLPGSSEAPGPGWLPLGIGGPVLESTPGSGTLSGVPALDLTGGGLNPTGPPATASWTRIMAFQAPSLGPAAGGGSPGLWITTGGSPIFNFNKLLWVTGNLDANGDFSSLQVLLSDAAQGGVLAEAVTSPITKSLSDGGWHLLVFGVQGTAFVAWLDGVAMTIVAGGPFSPVDLSGGGDALISETVGFGETASDNQFNGRIAFVAELPYSITAGQMLNLYSTFRYGGGQFGSGSSADRYADILRWGQWAGNSSLEEITTGGQTTDYGPASELIAGSNDSGTDVVSALQSVVDTENGTHFVAADGTITFFARRARYNQPTPVVIFGENKAGGEIPYLGAGFGNDPTLLGNDASITQTSTSTTTRVVDRVSVSKYGDVPLQRAVNTLDPLEVADAANYLVQRYSIPLQRVETITVDLAANPTAWLSMLSLVLGARVRVNRRPPNAPAIVFDGFVEKIGWEFTDQVTAKCTLEISPVGIGQNLSQLTATRAPLNAAVLAGATSIVVNVPTDAGGNTPQQNGWTPTAMPVVVIWDGAITEGCPVAGMSYAGQLVTIALSSPLLHAHASGTIVAEMIGVSWIDFPYNQFDSVALLDGTHALAY
jgi:hypothetical protein